MNQLVKQAVKRAEEVKLELAEEETRYEVLSSRLSAMTDRLHALEKAEQQAKQRRAEATLQFGIGEASEEEVRHTRKTHEEVEQTLLEVRDLVNGLEQAMEEHRARLPELRESMRLAERGVWGELIQQHHEVMPPEVVRWFERGYVILRELPGSGERLQFPEYSNDRLASVREQMRKELGL